MVYLIMNDYLRIYLYYCFMIYGYFVGKKCEVPWYAFVVFITLGYCTFISSIIFWAWKKVTLTDQLGL